MSVVASETILVDMSVNETWTVPVGLALLQVQEVLRLDLQGPSPCSESMKPHPHQLMRPIL